MSDWDLARAELVKTRATLIGFWRRFGVPIAYGFVWWAFGWKVAAAALLVNLAERVKR